MWGEGSSVEGLRAELLVGKPLTVSGELKTTKQYVPRTSYTEMLRAIYRYVIMHLYK